MLHPVFHNDSRGDLKPLLFLAVQQFSSILLLSVRQDSKFIDIFLFLHFQTIFIYRVIVFQIGKLHSLGIYSGKKKLLSVLLKMLLPNDILEFLTLLSSQLRGSRREFRTHRVNPFTRVIMLNISHETNFNPIFLLILNHWHKCWLLYYICFSLISS